MKPGDRKERWRSSHNASGVILFLFGCLWLGTNAPYIAMMLWGLAFLDFRDASRGWRLKPGRPPWANRQEQIDRGARL